jgi:hypothetical protein
MENMLGRNIKKEVSFLLMDSGISAKTVYDMSLPSGNFAYTSKVLSLAGSLSTAYISVVSPS